MARYMTRSWLLCLSVAVVALLAAGCGGSSDTTGPGDDSGGVACTGEEPLDVRYIGSSLLETGRSVVIALVGKGLSADVVVYLRQGDLRKRAVFTWEVWGAYEFRARMEADDLGYWDIVVQRGQDKVVMERAIRLVENVLRAQYEDFLASGGEVRSGQAKMKIRHAAFTFPPGESSVPPDELIDCSEDLVEVFDKFGVYEVEKIFASADWELSKFYRVWFPTSVEVIDVVVALDDLGVIMSAWWVSVAHWCD